MSELLERIDSYWTKRADSFGEGMFTPENEARWLSVLLENLPEGRMAKILDIGTGPGFFAVLLARQGYEVTAVDYTQAMLDKAAQAAAERGQAVSFFRMDAQDLTFADETFDAIVTRNLTWNLEDPAKAYRQWRRVLKPGGVMLNFDSGWYEYLFDAEKAKAVDRDRENVKTAGLRDGYDYPDSPAMEAISRQLILSRSRRPQADLAMLLEAGFARVLVDTEIWKRTWDREEQINYASTPEFLLKAWK